MNIWKGLLVLACMLLSGCETMKEEQSKVRIEQADPRVHGIVFAGLGTQTGLEFDSTVVWVRPQGQGADNFVDDLQTRPHLNRAVLRYEGKVGSKAASKTQFGTSSYVGEGFVALTGKGVVSAAVLPAGRYEVYSFSWSFDNYYAHTPKFFSAPFEIKPGEAVYLGRLIANLTGAEQRKEWLFNVTVPDRAFFAGENRFDEDRAALEHAKLLPPGFTAVDDGKSLCRAPGVFCR